VKMPGTIAVINGDLVKSTSLPDPRLDLAFRTLKAAADEITRWQEPAISTAFSRNRGDGWQIFLASPRLALRAALFMRAALRSQGKDLSTRMAVGIAEGEPPDTLDLNTATGPAYVAAGHALDTMKAPIELRVVSDNAALEAVYRLADHLSKGWTQKQAAALMPMLAPGATTRQTVAVRQQVTRQAVGQTLRSAGYDAINDALRMVERVEPGK
jgi:hypothetical protein